MIGFKQIEFFDHTRSSFRTIRHHRFLSTGSGFRLLITGPHGFERTVTLAVDDDSAVIAERVRETLEE
jgi:hypothetical protein